MNDKVIGDLRETCKRSSGQPSKRRNDPSADSELYRITLEHSNDGVVIVQNGKFVYLNQKLLDLLGRERQELVGKTMDDFIHPDDRRRVLAYHRQRQAGEPVPATYEARIVAKTGAFLDMDVSVTSMTYHGRPAFLTYLRDITARKKTEEALRLSEEKFRALIRGSADIIVVVDEKAFIHYESPSTQQLLGYPADHFLGKSAFAFIHPDDADTVRSVFQTVVSRTNPHKNLVFRFLRDDSAWIYLEAKANNLMEQPPVKGIVITARDVTDRITTEIKLRESEKNIRDLVELLPQIVFEVDRQGEFTFVNQYGLDLLGYSREDFDKGVSIMEVLLPKYHPYIVDTITGILKGEMHYDGQEFRAIKKNGFEFTISVYAAPIISGGVPLGVRGIAVDITAQKRIEKEMRASEILYRTIFETTGTATIIVEEDTTISLVNTGFASLARTSKEYWEGKRSWTEIVAEHDKERMVAYHHLRREDPDRAPRNYTFDFVDGEGNVRKVLLTVAMIPGTRKSVASMADIAELERKDASLRESEARLRQIIDLVPHLIFAKNREGQFIMANQAVAELYGTTVTGLIGKGDIDFNPNTDEVRHFLKDDLEVMNSGISKDIREEQITDAAGRVRYLNTIKIPFHPPSTQEEAILGVSTDITSRKQAEEELRKSEEKYRRLMEEAPIGFCLFDTSGNIQYVNRIIEKESGWSREELIGKNVFGVGFFDADTKCLLLERLAMRLAGDVSRQLEVPLVCKNGKKLFVEIRTDILVEDGLPYGAKATITNITQRKEAEDALRESEKLYRNVLENTQDVFYRSDVNGKLTMINPSFLRVLGYNVPEDVLGKDIAKDFYAEPEDRERVLEEIFKTGSVKDCEVRLKRRDGKVLIVATNSHFYYDRDGAVAGVEGFFQDITERKKEAEEKRKLETQLYHAQKMEAIGALAGGVAHDFNNVLMGMQGYVSLMLYGLQEDHSHYPMLQSLEEHIRRGANLTRQMLGFVKGEKNETIPANIEDIVQKSAELFGHTHRDINIRVAYGEDLPLVEVDCGQIDQVLLNLYINASQAMPAGGTIDIKVENIFALEDHSKHLELRPGRYVSISVTDTGIGMDENTRKRIFEPFFTTKATGGGTGLGLASAYGIIRNHGGLITVTSQIACGSTFTILLPASTHMQPMLEVQEETAMAGTGTILLVDDELSIAETTSMMLENMGYRVYMVGNGHDAVQIYRQRSEEIDLVLLDLILPGMSGAKTFAALREINSQVRVLLCSGYCLAGEADKVMKNGCHGFIQKPFRINHLCRKIEDIIGG
jgi:two-component system, cell cycle sensor histidine kinase and response regulator CckA